MAKTALFYLELVDYLLSHPAAYQLEMTLHVFDEFDIVIAVSTICRSLKEQTLMWKMLRVAAAQRNEELRLDGRARLLNWDAEQLVFI